MHILITGTAGFIGYHVAQHLLQLGHHIIGVDNINGYYETTLKEDRLSRLHNYTKFEFHRLDIADQSAVEKLFKENDISKVIHLAAQAGVRYSLHNPQAYINSNILGFANILECCRHHNVEHLIYASSSSVYGANTQMPFSVQHSVDHPVSLYAATKKSNELLAHTYSHLYGLPTTGLRFFTVYGPWGRPDMAYYSFTKKILAGETIQVFNHGQMKRDFTYIDDILVGIVSLIDRLPQPDPDWNSTTPDPASSYAPYKVYNIGNHKPVALLSFIETLEELLGKKAEKQFLPMQAGEVLETYADISNLQRDIGFNPSTKIEEGLKHFVAWYREYYNV